MGRREYPCQIKVNGTPINRVVIDDHYEQAHAESITDSIILRLVMALDGGYFEPDEVKDPYSYYVTEGLILDRQRYKLIWLLEDQNIYIGVVNAYRRS